MPVAHDHPYTTLLLLMALNAALLGGIFFAFSNFVMQALDELDPRLRVEAMVRINKVVLNRIFLVLFFAAAGGSALTVLMLPLLERDLGTFILVSVASLLSLGGFVITVCKNVPLNERLRREFSQGNSVNACWSRFFRPWMFWNRLRCAFYLGASACFMWATQ